MGIFYTQHILERTLMREITRELVELALSKGEIREQDGFVRFEYAHDGKNLRLITKRRQQHFILVTAYFYE